MGGHPDTTGIRNVDYFISSVLIEPPDADAHYSEKLVRLTAATAFYDPPNLPSPLKDRQTLGLPVSGSLYVCPMMLQKIHPDFDKAVEKLLQADPGGYVIFFNHPNAGWESDLKRRFDRTIAAPQRERVLFLSWIKDYADFVSLNALADVVLDPFHFGIGTTAIASFAVGTPIVTLPGEFMRGRVGLFYSRLLDAPEFVASDLDDYVAKAVRMATDREWRNRVSEKIRANRHHFYENRQAIEDLTKFFVGLTATEGAVT
jgi:predicted O-linked N-acetylglucosamine transferase (SPINDLY family)